jgi:hypothetical protein
MSHPTEPLSAAEAEVARAKQAVDVEEARITAARAEVEAAGESIRQTNPDANVAIFAKLVQARDAASGRLEALTVRVESATKARAEAEAPCAEARRVYLTGDLQRLQAKLIADIDTVTTALRRAAVKVAASLRAHHALAKEVRTAARTAEVDIRVHTPWVDIEPGDLAAVGRTLGDIASWEQQAPARAERRVKELAYRAAEVERVARVAQEAEARRAMADDLRASEAAYIRRTDHTHVNPLDYSPFAARN